MSDREPVQTNQSHIGGNYAGNNHSNNTHYSAHIHVPTASKQRVADISWGVPPPEIDLQYLADEQNQPKPGTGKWIFEDERYKDWRKGQESKLLWLHGGPGTGKTMLAKHVAAKLLGEQKDPPGGVKLVFYFASPELPTDETPADEPKLWRSRLAKVASDLLYSILQQDGRLAGCFKDELRNQGEILFTNPHSLWKLLGKAIQDHCNNLKDPLYILIDGIDGLDEALCKELINRILELMEIYRVKIFLSSRNVLHVSNNLSTDTRSNKIDLDKGGNANDINFFIDQRVNALKWSDDDKKRAREALSRQSEGNFLWASLVTENLACFGWGSSFEDFLKPERTPSKLQAVYRRMLDALSTREELGKVLHIIRSVALILRPLRFDELGHILAYMEEKEKTGPQSSRRGASTGIRRRTNEKVEDYVRASQGFLRVIDLDGTASVSIVHHTATEYLFDKTRKDGLVVLSKSEGHLKVSWECFRYLDDALRDLEEPLRNDVNGYHNRSLYSSSERGHQGEEPGRSSGEVAAKDPWEAEWPCLRYASEFWLIHAHQSIEISGDKFCADPAGDWLKYQFFKLSDIIRRPWIKFYGDPRMEVLTGIQESQLHIAVCLGLMPLVKAVVPSVIEETRCLRLLLHRAAKSMSGSCKILIDRSGKFHLTAQDENGNTPLHEAVISGYGPMMEELVEKFATLDVVGYEDEINKQNNSGDTPLHLAVRFDHPEIVKFLVKNHADTTIKNIAQETPAGLGKTLGRTDSLAIIKEAEEIREAKKKSIAAPPQASRTGPPQDPSLASQQAPPPAPSQTSRQDRARARRCDCPRAQRRAQRRAHRCDCSRTPPHGHLRERAPLETRMEAGEIGIRESDPLSQSRQARYLFLGFLALLFVAGVISIPIAASAAGHK